MEEIEICVYVDAVRENATLRAQLRQVTQERDRLQQSGDELNAEFHAAIGEQSYAGTRADWKFRAQSAEAEVTRLTAQLEAKEQERAESQLRFLTHRQRSDDYKIQLAACRAERDKWSLVYDEMVKISAQKDERAEAAEQENRTLRSRNAEVEAVLEAVVQASEGEAVSDFMESFAPVRFVLDQAGEIRALREQNDQLTTTWAESRERHLKAEAREATLRARLHSLEFYVEHKAECATVYPTRCGKAACTCGLAAVLAALR